MKDKTIRKEIKAEIARLEEQSGLETFLVLTGIAGLFFFLVPGIIAFCLKAAVASSRKTKCAVLKAQLLQVSR